MRMQVSEAKLVLQAAGYNICEVKYDYTRHLVVEKRLTTAEGFAEIVGPLTIQDITIYRITIERDNTVSRTSVEALVAAIKPQDTVQTLATELAENYLAATRGEIFNPDALAFVKRCREAKE